MKHLLTPLIEELDRTNAPIDLELRSREIFRTTAEILWKGQGEHLPVGSIEAVGRVGGHITYKLMTDRISYNFRFRTAVNKCITYRRLKGVLDGLIKHSIPLKPEELREMGNRSAHLKVQQAKHRLYGRLGHCHCLIGDNAEDVIDFLLYNRKSTKFEFLLTQLRDAKANLDVATEEYEARLHGPLPEKVY